MTMTTRGTISERSRLSGESVAPPSVNNAPAPEVVCICGGYGFPFGTASGARVAMVGRALLEAGTSFRLIHCGPSPVDLNRQRSGVYEGIRFDYTTPTKRPENRAARWLMYAWGLLGLTVRLSSFRARRDGTVIYLYVMDGLLNLYSGLLCRLFGLPVVQEMCEWTPGEPTISKFDRWLYGGPIWRQATGVLAITRVIEERVRSVGAASNPNLLVHRLTAVIDTDKFSAPVTITEHPDPTRPTFVYCGTWLRDVIFLLKAFLRVKQEAPACRLTLVGKWSADHATEIVSAATALGLSPDDLIMPGCVDEETLIATYRTATALLMPLWDDDRSITRLPNKMGEYLASGRPVVGSNIGDLTEVLFDGQNAYLSEPGNEASFAAKMLEVVADPDKADAVGAAGREAGLRFLDYRSSSSSLAEFFTLCSAWHRDLKRRSAARGLRFRVRSMLRNAMCGLLAAGLIATGAVRQARKRAFVPGVVTAVYFHKPERRIFERCVAWLKSNGYTFVSEEDVIQYLYQGKELPRGAVWLSFDDGAKELFEKVVPVAQRENLPYTLFLPSGIVEGGGRFPWEGHQAADTFIDARPFVDPLAPRDAISPEEAKRLAQLRGVSIGGHTVHHHLFDEIDADTMRAEIVDDKRSLEELLRRPIQTFAYPGGRFSGEEKPVLKAAGYRLAATTENAFIDQESDPFYVPRFGVGDNISFPEAICNMVGVWQPVMAPIKRLVRPWFGRSISGDVSSLKSASQA